MLPHTHHSNLSDIEHNEEHAEADDLMDYLKLIFHTDLGAEHLETYNQVNGCSFDFDFSVDIIPDIALLAKFDVFIDTHKGIHDHSIITYHPPILKQYFLSTTSFRGPPVLV